MDNYNIEMLAPSELREYHNNPRNNDEAVEYVANSIKEFGFKIPIVVDKDNTIIAGHTRKLAALELGLTQVPVIRADDLTEEQAQAFRLADNKVAEISTWNDEMLGNELFDIGMNYDMTDFGFGDTDNVDFDNESELDNEETDNPYTMKIDAPIYEMTGESPEIDNLYNAEKQKRLEDKIKKSNVPNEIKAFLHISSLRHIEFDYKKIAEYYAHADKETQELMEDSALVIVDYNKAVELGFVKLTENISVLAEEDDPNNE